MKKIRLFSTKAIKGIEGEEAELYVNFYLVLNRNYIFTFLIDGSNDLSVFSRIKRNFASLLGRSTDLEFSG